MPSATPVSTVVVVVPPPALCKVCDVGRVVVTAVPCIKKEKKLVYGCGSAHTFSFPATTVTSKATATAAATAAPATGCVRWVEVAVKTTCPQRKLVKACHQVVCPVKA
eukprot:contig_13425_g3212